MAAQDRDDEMSGVRDEIAATRAQMASTLASLEARVSGTMQQVQRSVNPLELARAHPWPALAVAVGAGVALSASGTDRRAASAAVQAGKQAPGAASRAAQAASQRAVGRAKQAVSGHGSYGAPYDTTTAAASRGGPLDRVARGLFDVVDARLAEMARELWRSATGLELTPAPARRPR